MHLKNEKWTLPGLGSYIGKAPKCLTSTFEYLYFIIKHIVILKLAYKVTNLQEKRRTNKYGF